MLPFQIRRPTLVENDRWLFARTLPKSEPEAEPYLGALGFHTDLPPVQKTIRHSHQVRVIRVALFQRYLFVILGLARDRWLLVCSAVGFSRLFAQEGQPVPVGIVESLIERTNGSQTRLDVGFVKGPHVHILPGRSPISWASLSGWMRLVAHRFCLK
jgi:hypothetical protein